ncbi:hypothetical protein JTB14_009853 [Gonioctena quinquepunctata]|nr:hypothetical protein JTB14_009853 [Gonioctena quinquepunctata]
MLAKIAPPQVRRETLAMAERSRQCDDPRHPLHQHAPPVTRLKSKRNFMQSTQPLTASKIATKEAKWEQRLADNDIPTWNPKKTSCRFGPRLGYLENPQPTPVPNGEMQEETCDAENPRQWSTSGTYVRAMKML